MREIEYLSSNLGGDALYVTWNRSAPDAKPQRKRAAKERRDPLTLARYFQSLLDYSGFDRRAALPLYLGVSRARVT